MNAGEFKVVPMEGGKLNVTFCLKKGGKDSEINVVTDNANQSYALFSLLAEGGYENVTEVLDVDLDRSLLHLGIKEMKQLMESLSAYGACDTEPRFVFRHIMETGKRGKIPDSAAKWELYSASMDCSKAGDILTKKAHQLLDILSVTPKKEIKAVYRYWGWGFDGWVPI